MADDEDVTAVRLLVAPRTTGEPPAWPLIAARLPDRQPRRATRPWGVWLVASVAGVAVLLASAAFSVLVRMYADQGNGSPLGSSPVAVGPGPTADVRGPGRGVGPFPDIAPMDANQALAELIAVASTAEPPTVQPGRLLYRHLTGWVSGQPIVPGDVVVHGPAGPVIFQDRETWIEPEGMIMVRVLMDGTDVATMPKNDQTGALAEARQRFAEVGPSLNQPTPAWLHTLPISAAGFRELLRPPAGSSSKWTDDHDIWVAAEDLLSAVDLFLPAPQRVGLYGMLAGLPNLTAAEIDADGRRLVAIRYSEAPTGMQETQPVTTRELLFDPTTGHAVGTGSLETGSPVRFQALWTQSLVTAVGERQ